MASTNYKPMSDINTISINNLVFKEKEIKKIIDNNLLGFFRVSFKGDILYASKTLKKIIRSQSAKKFAVNFLIQFTKDKKDGKIPSKKTIISNFKNKIVFNCHSGKEKKVLRVLSYLNKDDKFIDGFVQDTSSEIIAQEELAELKELLKESEFYKQIFAQTQDWISGYDLNGNFMDVSRNVKQITGYTRDELIGKNDFDIGMIPKKYQPLMHREWKRSIEGKRLTPKAKYEYELIRKDLKHRFFEANDITLFKGGEIIGSLTIARDITQRKNAEKKLKELNKNLETRIKERTKELEKLNKQIEIAFEDKIAFFQKASHQLRTPLTVIKGNIEFISHGKKDQTEFAIIQQEINKLARTISDFSYLATDDETKRQHLRKNIIDWKELLVNATRELNYAIKLEDIKFSYSIKGSVPYKGEANYLTKLIYHFISNAIKFSRQKGKINLSVKSSDKNVTISCKDNGVGISTKHLKQIFNKFYKANMDSAKNKKEGSGLGLSICKSIVDLHGGTIKISSKAGKGTTIRAVLPIL